jgi:hypothetical protein
MKRLFILILIFVFPFYSGIAQNTNSMLSEEERREMETIVENAPIEFFQLLEKEIANKPDVLKNINGEYSLNKFKILMSKILLEQQLPLLNLMAKEVLTKTEYGHYRKLDIRIDEKGEYSIPVITTGNLIMYDRKWIIDASCAQLFARELSNMEFMYYYISSNFENNPTPDYLDVTSFDASRFSNNMLQFLAIMVEQMNMSFLILMHEFYHSCYDKNDSSDCFDCELNADQFALEKLKMFWDIKTDHETLSNEELQQQMAEILNENIWNSIVSNDKCRYRRLLGKDITMGSYMAPLTGISFADFLIKRDLNVLLANINPLKLDLLRAKQFVNMATSYYKCEADSSNIFCCAWHEKLKDIHGMEMLYNTYNNDAISLVNNITSIMPTEEDILKIMPQNPTSLCFQIACYYLYTKDYDKSVQFFSLVNSFEVTEFSILCNMLCNDVYRLKIMDISKADFYLETARKQNEKIPTIGEKIINRNYANISIYE